MKFKFVKNKKGDFKFKNGLHSTIIVAVKSWNIYLINVMVLGDLKEKKYSLRFNLELTKSKRLWEGCMKAGKGKSPWTFLKLSELFT